MESYGAQKDSSADFCCMGANYKMKKVRIVPLARDTPPFLFIPTTYYQISQTVRELVIPA